MDRPDYLPARMESWRYASAYPRIPYRETATTVDPDDILKTEIWLNNPYRQLEDVMRKAIQAEMEEKFRRFFGGIDMNDDMKLKDLRSGYVVQTRDGVYWQVVEVTTKVGNTKILVNAIGRWNHLDSYYNGDLTIRGTLPGGIPGKKDLDICKVYGFVSEVEYWSRATRMFSSDHRKLLWERKDEAKKLTVDQISELLGYPVEIVGENR